MYLLTNSLLIIIVILLSFLLIKESWDNIFNIILYNYSNIKTYFGKQFDRDLTVKHFILLNATFIYANDEIDNDSEKQIDITSIFNKKLLEKSTYQIDDNIIAIIKEKYNITFKTFTPDTRIRIKYESSVNLNIPKTYIIYWSQYTSLTILNNISDKRSIDKLDEKNTNRELIKTEIPPHGHNLIDIINLVNINENKLFELESAILLSNNNNDIMDITEILAKYYSPYNDFNFFGKTNCYPPLKWIIIDENINKDLYNTLLVTSNYTKDEIVVDNISIIITNDELNNEYDLDNDCYKMPIPIKYKLLKKIFYKKNKKIFFNNDPKIRNKNRNIFK